MLHCIVWWRSSCSDVEENGWLVGELHLLNAEDWSVHLVVHDGQVSGGWSLTHAAELVVDGSVTQANPSLVGSQVWHWDATKMGADGGAAEDGGVTGIRDGGLGLLVELGGGWQSVRLVDLRLGETAHEDEVTVPGSLEHLTWWQLRDVELLVSVSDVSVTGDHLRVDDGHEGLDSEAVVSEDESLNHVHLGTSHLVVLVLLIPDSICNRKLL